MSETLPTVPAVDLNRYLGTWFEIARFPNGFERGLKCVTAHYSLRPDGKIEVINRGHLEKDPGRVKRSKGKAWQPDPDVPGVLKVQFLWPFNGDYYIIDLDPYYQFALVGEPRRRYLWLLCRTPEMEETVFDRLIRKAESLGFDVNKLRKVEQDCMAGGK